MEEFNNKFTIKEQVLAKKLYDYMEFELGLTDTDNEEIIQRFNSMKFKLTFGEKTIEFNNNADIYSAVEGFLKSIMEAKEESENKISETKTKKQYFIEFKNDMFSKSGSTQKRAKLLDDYCSKNGIDLESYGIVSYGRVIERLQNMISDSENMYAMEDVVHYLTYISLSNCSCAYYDSTDPNNIIELARDTLLVVMERIIDMI